MTSKPASSLCITHYKAVFGLDVFKIAHTRVLAYFSCMQSCTARLVRGRSPMQVVESGKPGVYELQTHSEGCYIAKWGVVALPLTTLTEQNYSHFIAS